MRKITIVEDDVLILEHLNRIVKSLGYEVLDQCASYDQAIKSIEINIPDLVLLDIRMNSEDAGIEVAKILNKQNVPFIFITSFSDKQTLSEAILQQPKGYILKPFTKEDIEKNLSEVFENELGKYIKISTNQRIEKIQLSEIIYIQSNNVYVDFIFKNKKITHRIKLSEVEKMLPEAIFWRIHQSFIINKKYIERYEYSKIHLNKEQLPISKKYIIDIRNKLHNI